MTDLSKITDLERLKDLLGKQDSGARRVINEDEMREALKGRIKGQGHVIDDLVRVIRLQWAKTQRKRPIANLLFLGPTGTGKTELAKAMAEYLFGDDRNMLRFFMGDYKSSANLQRLTGSSAGYVGYGAGGQLTRPMLSNPKRLVLFDEIEKAANEVFDIFLDLMGDGRLAEGDSGKVADFTQAIIVLTSNAEAEAIGKLQDQIEDYDEMIAAVKSHLAEAKVFRPEIVGRIDRIYVFKPLERYVIGEIATLMMVTLAKQYDLELVHVDPTLIVEAVMRGEKLSKFGARGLQDVIERMLGEAMLGAKEAGARRVQLCADEDGTYRIDSADEEAGEEDAAGEVGVVEEAGEAEEVGAPPAPPKGRSRKSKD